MELDRELKFDFMLAWKHDEEQKHHRMIAWPTSATIMRPLEFELNLFLASIYVLWWILLKAMWTSIKANWLCVIYWKWCWHICAYTTRVVEAFGWCIWRRNQNCACIIIESLMFHTTTTWWWWTPYKFVNWCVQ
jgi:hypothetical protein